MDMFLKCCCGSDDARTSSDATVQVEKDNCKVTYSDDNLFEYLVAEQMVAQQLQHHNSQKQVGEHQEEQHGQWSGNGDQNGHQQWNATDNHFDFEWDQDQPQGHSVKHQDATSIVPQISDSNDYSREHSLGRISELGDSSKYFREHSLGKIGGDEHVDHMNLSEPQIVLENFASLGGSEKTLGHWPSDFGQAAGEIADPTEPIHGGPHGTDFMILESDGKMDWEAEPQEIPKFDDHVTSFETDFVFNGTESFRLTHEDEIIHGQAIDELTIETELETHCGPLSPELDGYTLLHDGVRSFSIRNIHLATKQLKMAIRDGFHRRDLLLLAKGYGNLANVYAFEGMHDLAVRLYKLAIDLLRKQGDYVRERFMVSNCIGSYLHLGNTDAALDLARRQWDLLNTQHKNNRDDKELEQELNHTEQLIVGLDFAVKNRQPLHPNLVPQNPVYLAVHNSSASGH